MENASASSLAANAPAPSEAGKEGEKKPKRKPWLPEPGDSSKRPTSPGNWQWDGGSWMILPPGHVIPEPLPGEPDYEFLLECRERSRKNSTPTTEATP
jgi:hypothetical protein